jgi:hypothetical protein
LVHSWNFRVWSFWVCYFGLRPVSLNPSIFHLEVLGHCHEEPHV